MWTIGFILFFVKVGLVLLVLLTLAAYLVLVERKLLGRFQIRFGPNRAGPFGLLQPLCDGIKLILKEDIIPEAADRTIFKLAPALVVIVSMLTFAVVPFANYYTFWDKKFYMVITDLNIGVLFVLALSSLSVYGVALGGWASNSKYSLLGAVRGVAQMISYEIAMGLSLVPVVMLAHSFNLADIVEAQSKYPFILLQPVACVIFFISMVAEGRRLPFDLPESENELNTGYHTEYSGMRFALYFVGEYLGMIIWGALLATFFLGGWKGPLLPPLAWFLLKLTIAPFIFIWSRASLPRLRYDQLMHFGWKFLIPLGLLNILVTGGVALYLGG